MDGDKLKLHMDGEQYFYTSRQNITLWSARSTLSSVENMIT